MIIHSTPAILLCFLSLCDDVVNKNDDVRRWTYIEFYSRYSILMSQQEGNLSNKKQTCMNVLKRLIQVGSSSAHMTYKVATSFWFYFLSVLSILSSSPGPQPVQVWPHKNLLPSRSGCVSGEAASGPAERRLCHHPETLPWVEPETEVPAHETGSHHLAGVRTWKEVDPVRAAYSRLSF